MNFFRNIYKVMASKINIYTWFCAILRIVNRSKAYAIKILRILPKKHESLLLKIIFFSINIKDVPVR